jgi:hypothetical protein
VSGVQKATDARKDMAAQLLMKAMAHKNIPFNFVTSSYFKSYVDFVSASVFTAPTRYDLVKALEHICDTIATRVQNQLRRSPYMAICTDSWTSNGRHLTAVTAGNPGCTIYLNSYENLGSDSADAGAGALSDCVMTSLGYKVDMDPASSDFPHGKVAIMTSDTTNVMPATARELGKLPLCKGLLWAPCFPHVCNLLLLDQLKVPAIANLLAHSRTITAVFRNGSFRKLFLMCAAHFAHLVSSCDLILYVLSAAREAWLQVVLRSSLLLLTLTADAGMPKIPTASCKRLARHASPPSAS